MYKLTMRNIIILGAIYYFVFKKNRSTGQSMDYLGYGDGYQGIYGGDS